MEHLISCNMAVKVEEESVRVTVLRLVVLCDVIQWETVVCGAEKLVHATSELRLLIIHSKSCYGRP